MDLRLESVTKRYDSEQVLRGVELSLKSRTTLSILGPSGCGKTTMLKIIAGLVQPDSGTVRLGGEDITQQPPEHRRIVYLYQEPLLFPHLDVFENVAFGLRLGTAKGDTIRAETLSMLEELDLAAMKDKRPDQLSGGQRQRVAFGRALAIRPRLLLLDEPFSSLDPEIRTSMQQLFKRIAARHAITAIFVTHSLKECILMGDTIGHLRNGILTTYAARLDFLRDPDSGVMEEVSFWNALETQQP